MKKFGSKILAAVLSVALGLGVVGCGNSATSIKDSAANETDHLNIAIQAVPGYIPLYVLRDRGWLEEKLKDYNVEVKFTEFESGPPENESFAAGQQDVGVMGNVPSISGIAAGQNRVLIGISYNGEKTEATLVPSDSELSSIEDLKGKKIGLVVGSIAQNLLDAQLKSVGLTLSDVELVNLSPSEQLISLQQGQVDAVSAWEPNITKLQSEANAKVLADGTGVFLGENAIVADKDYVTNNPEITEIFLEQYKRAVKEVQDNPEQIAEEYKDTLGLSTEDFVKVLGNIEFPIDISDADITDLQGTADFLYENKLIDKELSIKDYIISDIDK